MVVHQADENCFKNRNAGFATKIGILYGLCKWFNVVRSND